MEELCPVCRSSMFNKGLGIFECPECGEEVYFEEITEYEDYEEDDDV